MITATGNNFGYTEPITLKDFQSDTLLILNGFIKVSTSTDAYKNATTLEIYVPTLRLSKSAMTTLIVGSSRLDGYGTALKSWIKDPNTIAIEKLPEWDSRGHLSIYFSSAYAALGSREPIDRNILQKSFISLTPGAGQQKLDVGIVVVSEHWYYLHIRFMKFIGENNGIKAPIECTLVGVPEDAEADIPLISESGYAYTPGTPVSHCYINGTTLSCPKGRYSYGEGLNEGDFINAFIIRNGQTTE